jgi:hypothetical protein
VLPRYDLECGHTLVLACSVQSGYRLKPCMT